MTPPQNLDERSRQIIELIVRPLTQQIESMGGTITELKHKIDEQQATINSINTNTSVRMAELIAQVGANREQITGIKAIMNDMNKSIRAEEGTRQLVDNTLKDQINSAKDSQEIALTTLEKAQNEKWTLQEKINGRMSVATWAMMIAAGAIITWLITFVLNGGMAGVGQ